ncbi:MAG: hypothetical protein ACLGIR_11010 [Actinomycetes bacterium]
MKWSLVPVVFAISATSLFGAAAAESSGDADVVACASRSFRLDELTTTTIGQEEIAAVVAARLARGVGGSIPEAVYGAVDSAAGGVPEVVWTIDSVSPAGAPRLVCDDEQLQLEFPTEPLPDVEFSASSLSGREDDEGSASLSLADVTDDFTTALSTNFSYNRGEFTHRGGGAYTRHSDGIRMDMRYEWFHRKTPVRWNGANRTLWVFIHEADYVHRTGRADLDEFWFRSTPPDDYQGHSYTWYDVQPGGTVDARCADRSFGISVPPGAGVSAGGPFCERHNPTKYSRGGHYMMHFDAGFAGTNHPQESRYLLGFFYERTPRLYLSAWARS